MAESDDIVDALKRRGERLKSAGDGMHYYSLSDAYLDIKAADRITSLLAANAKLKGEKDAWQPLVKLLAPALSRLINANAGLAKIKGQITLYEASPTKDQDAFEAWEELNDALVQAKLALTAVRSANEPEGSFEAGVSHPDAPLPTEPAND
jgi:hypothetical protein